MTPFILLDNSVDELLQNYSHIKSLLVNLKGVNPEPTDSPSCKSRQMAICAFDFTEETLSLRMTINFLAQGCI